MKKTYHTNRVIRKLIRAKSLVKGEIPSNSMAIGIPTKVIKYRSND